MGHGQKSYIPKYTANVYRDLQGSCRFFSAKGSKNHRETLYSSKGKIVYVIGNPCNIQRFKASPSYHRFFPLQSANVAGFPYNIHNILLLGV